MGKSDYNEVKFAYYWSGIHRADIIFSQNGVLHREKDINTSQWSSFEILQEGNGTYELPLLKIWKHMDELQKKDWGNSEIELSWGHRYQKHIMIEGIVEGKNMTAQVWAQRGSKSPLDLIALDNEIIGFIYTLRNGCIILIKPECENLSPLKYWNDFLLSKANYDINHIGTSYIPMRDGVKLATEVWLPADLSEGSKIPAIFVRTPYGRFMLCQHELRFVQRGYALVVQDTRGREDSEGHWVPMVNEINDGDDTLNWIAAQPWSDGRVGMIGGSYGGFVQWAAAASGNPHLKAIISLVTAGSPFNDIPRKGGTVLSGTLGWSFMMAEKRTNRNALVRDDWDKVLDIRPIKDIPQKVLGKDIYFWNQWMKHTDYDEFWRKSDWSLYGDKIDVPALIISGWYDDDGMGTTEAWEMNEKYKRDNQRLILGPWIHNANTTRDIHNVPFGNNAIRYDIDLLYLRWFDRFLKGIDNGVEKESRVEYYMVGENQWKVSEKWPPEEIKYTSVYIYSQGNAKSSSGDGYIKSDITDEQSTDTYIFDPKNPAPYLIDLSENECSVPENYKDVEKRQDVLVYTSSPLKQDVAIAGDVYAVLYASSSARDTDWVVRLTDVDENGNSIRLSDGLVRARYRNSYEKPELLEPGKVEKYEIKMTKIANVFKKGHRIRVQITSGAKNLAFANHNTGKDFANDTDVIIAAQTVYHDRKHPSHIKLPVLYGNL